jgi:hypothetical protein
MHVKKRAWRPNKMHFNFPIAAQSIRESIIILYKAKIPIHIEEKLAKG